MKENNDVAFATREEVSYDEATQFTKDAIEARNQDLNFLNKQDFIDAERGFIVTFADNEFYSIPGPVDQNGISEIIAEMRNGKLYAPNYLPVSVDDDLRHVIFDLNLYDFLDEQSNNDGTTVNPSLWRQSRLNKKHGLFEVLENQIYQVRGYDLANITFILTTHEASSEKQWLVVDPLTCKETAAAAYER